MAHARRRNSFRFERLAASEPGIFRLLRAALGSCTALTENYWPGRGGVVDSVRYPSAKQGSLTTLIAPTSASCQPCVN